MDRIESKEDTGFDRLFARAMAAEECLRRISAIAAADWDELLDVRLDRQSNVVDARVNSGRLATTARALSLRQAVLDGQSRKTSERLSAMSPTDLRDHLIRRLSAAPVPEATLSPCDEGLAERNGDGLPCEEE